MNKKVALNSAPVLAVFSVVLVVLAVLRTLVIKNSIEGKTGFYIGTGVLVTVFNIIAIAAAVCSIAFCFLKFRKSRLNIRFCGKAAGFGFIIIALGALYDIYVSMSLFVTSKAGTHFTAVFTSARAETTNILTDIIQGYTLLIGSIFALFSILYFIFAAVDCFGGSGDYSKHRLTALCPIWWFVFKVLYFLLVPVDIKKISDMLYELIMSGFLLLFFSAFARVSSRVDGEYSAGRAIGYGMCASVFALISSVPRLITGLMGVPDAVYTSVQSSTEVIFKSSDIYCSLALFIFCTIFVFSALRKISSGAAETESEKEISDLEAITRETAEMNGEEFYHDAEKNNEI